MPQKPFIEKSRMRRRHRETSYESILKHRKRRRIIGIGVIGLLVLVLAGMLPVYQSVRKWNATRNERLAEKALAAEDFEEARSLAQKCLRENPASYPMLKVLHTALVALKDPKASELAPALARNPAGTMQSRLEAFQEACAELPLPSVFRSWLTLPEQDRKQPGFLKAFANRLIEQEMTGEAEEILRQSPHTPRYPDLQLMQARCWIRMAAPSDWIRAQKRIADLMESGGPTALSAFRLLALVPTREFRSGYFTELGPWLKQQPGVTSADHLLGSIQSLARFPGEKAKIVGEFLQSFQEKDPVACARWLQRLEMSQEAMSLGVNVAAEEWAPVKADLLADLGLWHELDDWLSTAPSGLTKIEALTWRVIAAEKLGDSTRSMSWLQMIQREAKAIKSSNVLLDVAAQTHEAGMENVSREAMLGAVMLQRGRLPFWSGVRSLVPWLRESKRSDSLFLLYQVMSEIDFTSPEPRLEVLDTSVVNNTIAPTAGLVQLDQLAKMFTKISAESRYHEVRATMLLADQKPKEALDALNDARQSARVPSTRRTCLTVLAKAATVVPRPEAQAVRESIPWRDMTGKEREFFSAWLDRQFVKPK